MVENWSDIDFKMRKISSSGDVQKVTNENSINQSLRSLFNTRIGERRHNPTYGTNSQALLFEPLDAITAREIIEDIKYATTIWEGSRVKITTANISVLYELQQYKIDIEYDILSTTDTGTLEFVLQKI